MKTLPVYIFRCSLGDCTNGGISATGDKLYLACPDGYVDTPEDDPRLIRLVKRDLPWMDTPYVHAEPTNDPRHHDGVHVGPMAGGNFVYTSDSRFPATYPIPLHDRYETQALYDLLSH